MTKDFEFTQNWRDAERWAIPGSAELLRLSSKLHFYSTYSLTRPVESVLPAEIRPKSASQSRKKVRYHTSVPHIPPFSQSQCDRNMFRLRLSALQFEGALIMIR